MTILRMILLLTGAWIGCASATRTPRPPPNCDVVRSSEAERTMEIACSGGERINVTEVSAAAGSHLATLTTPYGGPVTVREQLLVQIAATFCRAQKAQLQIDEEKHALTGSMLYFRCTR